MEELIAAAQSVRKHAYCPYSHYSVGASVRAGSGKLYSGCNVENLSFGATICAERNAIAAMVAGGENELVEAAISTADGAPPCGMCLQVLSEFAPSPDRVIIYCTSDNGKTESKRLSEMFPVAFRSICVGKEDSGKRD